MNTVTIEVASRAQLDARFLRAMETGHPQGASTTFPSIELLWSTMPAKRWELLRVLCGAGPVSVREAARRVDPDVKRVHEDVQVLLGVGVLDRSDDGCIVFPYDGVHVDFTMPLAALVAVSNGSPSRC